MSARVSYDILLGLHTANSGSEMIEAKHVSRKNIFWSTLTVKSRGGKIFEFLRFPFEVQANMHHQLADWPVLFGWWLKSTANLCRESAVEVQGNDCNLIAVESLHSIAGDNCNYCSNLNVFLFAAIKCRIYN